MYCIHTTDRQSAQGKPFVTLEPASWTVFQENEPNSLSCKAPSLVFSAYFMVSSQRRCSIMTKSVVFQIMRELFDISVFLITLKLSHIFVSGITLCHALRPHLFHGFPAKMALVCARSMLSYDKNVVFFLVLFLVVDS